MELTVYGPLRGVTGSKTTSLPAVNAKQSLRDILDRFVEAYPRPEVHLFDEDGTLKGSVRILVNSERGSR